MSANRFAIVENGVVKGLCITPDMQRDAPTGIVCGPEVETGWLWDGSLFSSPPAPPPVVPETVTLAQARAALMQVGLFERVDSFVKNSSNPVVKMAWEYTNNVSRDGKLVEMLAPELNLTSDQLDQLFITAAAIAL